MLRSKDNRSWFWPLASGLVVFVLYALSRTANLALAHDAAGYLLQIERMQPSGLIHPHHLLYNVVAAGWLAIVRMVVPDAGGATTVALLNSIAGAVAVALLVRMLLIHGRARLPVALAASFAAAFSFGLWFYSVAVEVYVIPLAFLLGALNVALGRPGLAGSRRVSPGLAGSRRVSPGLAGSRRALTVGALHGFAMLFHQVHVLFGLVIVVLLWRQRASLAFGRQLFAYIASGSVVVLAGYGLAILWIVRPSSPAEAWDWFTLYAQEGNSYLQMLSAGSLAKAVVGITRAFVGAHFAFAIPAVQGAIASAFPDKILADEIFLVRGLPSWLPALLLGLSALLGLAVVAMLSLLAWRPAQSPEAGDLRAVLVTWVLLYGAFFLFWDPYNVEFWIPQTTVLWLLIGLGVASQPDKARVVWTRLLVASVALLLFINGLGSIGPAASPGNDIFSVRLDPVRSELGPGDLLILDRDHILGSYARLATGVDVVGVGETLTETGSASVTVQTVVDMVTSAFDSGHSVAVSEEVFTPPATTFTVYGPEIGSIAEELARRFPQGGTRLVGSEAGYRLLTEANSAPPPDTTAAKHRRSLVH